MCFLMAMEKCSYKEGVSISRDGGTKIWTTHPSQNTSTTWLPWRAYRKNFSPKPFPVFGCKAVIHICPHPHTPRANNFVFVGNSVGSSASHQQQEHGRDLNHITPMFPTDFFPSE